MGTAAADRVRGGEGREEARGARRRGAALPCAPTSRSTSGPAGLGGDLRARALRAAPERGDVEAARLRGVRARRADPGAGGLGAGRRLDESRSRRAAGSSTTSAAGRSTSPLLETRDGLLRVVGHDGDNFLGGRDFDWAIVDWALAEIARTQGVTVSRADPRARRRAPQAQARGRGDQDRAHPRRRGGASRCPRRSRWTARRSTSTWSCRGPRSTRSARRSSTAPSRCCRRLLAAHGLDARSSTRVVLVGGPTVMPSLREPRPGRARRALRRGPRSDDARRAGRRDLRGDGGARRAGLLLGRAARGGGGSPAVAAIPGHVERSHAPRGRPRHRRAGGRAGRDPARAARAMAWTSAEAPLDAEGGVRGDRRPAPAPAERVQHRGERGRRRAGAGAPAGDHRSSRGSRSAIRRCRARSGSRSRTTRCASTSSEARRCRPGGRSCTTAWRASRRAPAACVLKIPRRAGRTRRRAPLPRGRDARDRRERRSPRPCPRARRSS